MKKVISLLCVLGMFAIVMPTECFAAQYGKAAKKFYEQSPQTIAAQYEKAAKKLYEPSLQDNQVARRQSKTRLYEPAVEDNIISLGKRDKAHGHW